MYERCVGVIPFQAAKERIFLRVRTFYFHRNILKCIKSSKRAHIYVHKYFDMYARDQK